MTGNPDDIVLDIRWPFHGTCRIPRLMAIQALERLTRTPEDKQFFLNLVARLQGSKSLRQSRRKRNHRMPWKCTRKSSTKRF